MRLRAELDLAVREKAEQEGRRQQQGEAEAAGVQLFQQAKKVSVWEWIILIQRCVCLQRMTRLRKEKEKELFQEFQGQQQRMADLLLTQRQQERSNEDEMIAKAVQEQCTKKGVRVCEWRMENVHKSVLPSTEGRRGETEIVDGEYT